jgi:hypothetical protein
MANFVENTKNLYRNIGIYPTSNQSKALDLWLSSVKGSDYFTTYNFEEDTYQLEDSYKLEVNYQNIKKPKEKLELSIGDKKIYLDPKLHRIKDIVENSRNILELENDWDDNGALASKDYIYYRSIEILVRYAQSVFVNHQLVIDNPEINLCRDGSIDLEWRKKGLMLLINIQNKENIDIHYYGEDYNKNTILKGFLDSFKLNLDLVFWMRKLDINVAD